MMKTYPRKIGIMLIIFFLLSTVHFPYLPFLSINSAMANSGPSFWQGYPTSEVLAVNENSPIAVEHEKLVFDLGKERDYYTVQGWVQASYDMVNPTDNHISVQMAFPFVSSLNDFSPDDVTITADGEPLNYEVYLGDPPIGSLYSNDKEITYDFEKIISSISKETYQARQFSADEIGKLYTIDVKPLAERVNIAIDFTLDQSRTKVLTRGFNAYGRSGQDVQISAWCYEPESLEILVLGDEPDFRIEAYDDGELKQKSDSVTYEIKSKDMSIKNYLMEIRNDHDFGHARSDKVSESEYFNHYARSLDRALIRNEGFSTYEDLIGEDYQKRVVTLVYTVEFPPNSKKNVTVGYQATGTMDKRETREPIYTFNYLLNPAQYWSSFGSLTIEVFTPEETPYIIESNIDFTQEDARHYIANLDYLPQGDLSFAIYHDQEISLLDKLLPSAYGLLLFGYIFLRMGLFIAVIILLVVVIRKYILRKGL